MLTKFIPLLKCVNLMSGKLKTFNTTKLKDILLYHDSCSQIKFSIIITQISYIYIHIQPQQMDILIAKQNILRV